MNTNQEFGGTKACQHKQGDKWDDACCGKDAAAKNTPKADQAKDGDVETSSVTKSV